MPAIINSFFTQYGQPKTGLSPTLRIWEIVNGVPNLLIGSPNGSYSNSDETMLEIVDGSTSDGFYSFEFTDVAGYSNDKHFLVRIDGGISLPSGERYQSVVLDPASAMNLQDAASYIWDALKINHLQPGSFGEAVAHTKADTTNLILTLADVQTLINMISKYDTNRTKIDPINKTLTVYDNDCTTPLRVFELYDSNGNLSVSEVCERVPVQSTDDKPVCL